MSRLHSELIKTYFSRADDRYLCLKILRERQYAPPDIWQSEHNYLLKRRLIQAYDEVPYYHHLMVDQGILRREQIEADTIMLLPVLTKKILRERFDDLQATSSFKRHTFMNASGGSTGQPTHFIQDREYANWTGASKILFDEWAGFQEGEKRIRLWGSSRDLFDGPSVRRIMGQILMNERWLNAFDLRRSQLNEYISIINAFRPVMLLGYADALYTLSRFSTQQDTPLYSPRCVMSSAGNLYPGMRSVIEEAFKTKVYNRYGSREVGDVSSECSCGSMHMIPWVNHVEVLDEQGRPTPPGVSGRLTITPLMNASMPLLRYDIGDIGAIALQECTCGRSLPVLTTLEGRTTDRFRLRDGSFVSAMALIHMIGVETSTQEIEKFQMIQRDYDDYLLKLVVAENKNLSDSVRQEIQYNVSKILHISHPITIELVNHIPPTPSGKFRYIQSMVPEEVGNDGL